MTSEDSASASDDRPVCEWCGECFDRPHNRGPAPRFCSRGHRQRAYEERKHAADIEQTVVAATLPVFAEMEKVQEMVGSMNPPVFAEMEKVQEMVGSMNLPAIDKMQKAVAGIDASAVSGLSQAVLGIDNSIIEAVGTWAEGIEFGALDAVSSAAASLDLSRFSGIEGTLRSMELSVLQEFASAAAGIDYTRIVELPQVMPASVDFSVLGGLSTSATGIDSIFEGLAAASAASIDSAFAEIIGSSLSGIETVLGQVGSAYDGIASMIEELADWDASDQSSEGAGSRGALTAPPDLLEVAVFITLVVVLGCYVLPAAIAAGATATVSSARALGLGLELIDAVYERNAAVRGALYLVGGIGGPLGILAYLDGRSRRRGRRALVSD